MYVNLVHVGHWCKTYATKFDHHPQRTTTQIQHQNPLLLRIIANLPAENDHRSHCREPLRWKRRSPLLHITHTITTQIEHREHLLCSVMMQHQTFLVKEKMKLVGGETRETRCTMIGVWFWMLIYSKLNWYLYTRFWKTIKNLTSPDHEILERGFYS